MFHLFLEQLPSLDRLCQMVTCRRCGKAIPGYDGFGKAEGVCAGCRGEGARS